MGGLTARSVPLDESTTATFTAAGRAEALIGPVSRQTWRTVNVAVSSTSTSSTTARVYSGAEAPGNLLAGTYSGNGDNAGISVTLAPGQRLRAVWAGGTPGARATISVYGTMEVYS